MDPLAHLHRRIRACTKCVAAGYLREARPVVDMRDGGPIVIVGQAPGIVERETRRPFSGRSGEVLRRWMAEAGLGLDEMPYRTAVTKCFPGKAAAGEGDRRPSPAEIALCAPWIDAELALIQPAVMLLVGQLAIERRWGRVPLHEAVGRSRREGGRVYIPLPHPSGTSRWLNDERNRTLLRRALRLLRREVERLRRDGRIATPASEVLGPEKAAQSGSKQASAKVRRVPATRRSVARPALAVRRERSRLSAPARSST